MFHGFRKRKTLDLQIARGPAIVQSAKDVSAYLKCLSELRAGNLEFSITANELEQKLNDLALPEVEYFMQTFVPACALPLDGILKGLTAQVLSK